MLLIIVSKQEPHMADNSTDQSGEDRMPPRGPLGDARPDHDAPDPRTRGGQKQERVENRPNVGVVEPEDYPDPAGGGSK